MAQGHDDAMRGVIGRFSLHHKPKTNPFSSAGALWSLYLFSHGPRLVLTPKAHLASHKSFCTSGEFLCV